MHAYWRSLVHNLRARPRPGLKQPARLSEPNAIGHPVSYMERGCSSWGHAAKSSANPLSRPQRALPTSPVPKPTNRSEEHTSELQSLMRISYAVFCLKKKKNNSTRHYYTHKHTTQQ